MAESGGRRPPDGGLLDVGRQPTTLAQNLGGKLAAIVFYRSSWCLDCDIARRTHQTQSRSALAEPGIA